jgi:hypothetical protein
MSVFAAVHAQLSLGPRLLQFLTISSSVRASSLPKKNFSAPSGQKPSLVMQCSRSLLANFVRLLMMIRTYPSSLKQHIVEATGSSEKSRKRWPWSTALRKAYYLAELHRLNGELLLIQSRNLSGTSLIGAVIDENTPLVAKAKECFHESIRIAKQQKAKSWELRASMSLARLYQKQNKHEEARDVLAQIYDSFTKGFDTADLREAKALLDKLS